MMEGVRILAENVITSTQYNFVWNGFTAFLYALAVYNIFLSVIFIMDYNRAAVVSMTLVIISIVVGTSVAITAGTEEVYDYTEYTVIVDDTVNMNEFMEKYDILDRDGKIYIVREVIENE